LAARLNHPNVIHTYEVGEQDGVYFIAMEYLDGQPLNRILFEANRLERPIRHGIIVRVVCDALAGLHYAHELKDYDGRPIDIVHRDVSPHNVFVTYDGQVKVVDFGIAKAALSRTQTEVGVLKGKVAYMSPEQALGEPLDRRSDLFAMGIVLWEALTRKRLFSSESAASTLHRLLNTPIARVSTVVPQIDPRLDDVIDRALSRRAADRFQTAQEMRDALEACLEHTGEVARQEEAGRLISDLFKDVREDVKRQVQAHMAAIAADPSTTSGELPAVGPAGRHRWGTSTSSQRLPAIDVEVDVGSGSGSRPSGRMRSSGSSSVIVEGQRSRLLPALVVLVLLLGIITTGVLVLHFGVRRSTATAASASSAVGSAAAPSGVAPEPAATAATTASVAQPAASPAPEAAPPPAPSPVAASPVPPPWTRGRTPSAPVVRPAGGPRIAPAQPSDTGGDAPAPAANQPGYLTLDTYPWTHVSEGGRLLGDTPLIHVPLPPGGHTLTLDNPEQGIHQSYGVTIKSGESVNRRLGLK
jgi:serine/threonine-protein kinase